MGASRRATIVGACLLLALGACRCGDSAALTTIFTDLEYTPDGRALVLEASDGLYLASPPTASPRRLSLEHCSGSQTYALDCLRVAASGEWIAALLRPREEGEATLYELHRWPLGEDADPIASAVHSKVADGVLDAAFSPDGRELVWARPTATEGAVAIWRLGPGAAEERIVESITLGAAGPSAAISSIVVTSFGVAYPRQVQAGDPIELWLRTFDGEFLDIGRLPPGCAGASLAGCVFPSPDGTSLVWQEEGSAVIHLYRAHKRLDLPLGQGYGFSFTRSGAFALRMDVQPDAAYVQRADTAAVVRAVPAASGELSFDGETLAYLTVESKALGTARLFVGPSRQDGRDNDYGVFTTPPVRPLLGASVGLLDIDHAFSGDGRFVLVAERGEQDEARARLVAVDANTSERRPLDEIACSNCCLVAPAGALLVCLPTLDAGTSAPLAVDLYDPATGLKTRASESVIDLQPLNDGSGVAVMQYEGTVPEVLVVTKDGRRASLGSAVRVAVSPVAPEIAVLDALGSLDVGPLP